MVGSVTAFPFTVVEPLAQVITGFAPPASVTFGAVSLNLVASGGASGNPVVFATTSAATVCSVSGTTMRFEGVGTCNLTANQAGSAEYAIAPQVAVAIANAPAVPVISFSPLPATARVGTELRLTATSTSGAVTDSTLNSEICSVRFVPRVLTLGCGFLPLTHAASTLRLTLKVRGACTVTANSVAQGNFSAAVPIIQNITITKGEQRISQLIVPPSLVGGTSSALAATGGASGNAITFSSTSAASVCTIAGSTQNFH